MFTFTPTVVGAYTFVFRATNEAGQADATLTVSVSAPSYDQWMASQGYATPPARAATNETSGQTYEWHYVTDISTATNTPLEIVITNAATGTFTIPAASENRQYQLVYSTNLLHGFATNDLGRGDPDTPVPFPSPSDWFGRLRVFVP